MSKIFHFLQIISHPTPSLSLKSKLSRPWSKHPRLPQTPLSRLYAISTILLASPKDTTLSCVTPPGHDLLSINGDGRLTRCCSLRNNWLLAWIHSCPSRVSLLLWYLLQSHRFWWYRRCSRRMLLLSAQPLQSGHDAAPVLHPSRRTSGMSAVRPRDTP
nr:hypothetical protein CFP56_33459 [Quercus suber]